MKFKNLMLALAIAVMVASCGDKKENTEATADSAATEAPANAEAEAAPEADAKTLITKKWVLENMDVTKAMKDIPKESQAEFKKSIDEMIAKTKGKTSYDLQEGGKAVLEYMNFEDKWKTEDGTWSLSDDGKTLSITGKDGKKQDMTVTTLTATSLDIETEGMIMKLVPKA